MVGELESTLEFKEIGSLREGREYSVGLILRNSGEGYSIGTFYHVNGESAIKCISRKIYDKIQEKKLEDQRLRISSRDVQGNRLQCLALPGSLALELASRYRLKVSNGDLKNG